MRDLKNIIVRISAYVFFIASISFTLYLLEFFSDLYLSFINSKPNLYDANTAGVVGVSLFVFIIYGLTLFLNINYKTIKQIYLTLILAFVFASVMILTLSLFFLRINFVIVIPIIIAEILLLYAINNFKLYKVKLFYYNSAYYRRKIKKNDLNH